MPDIAPFLDAPPMLPAPKLRGRVARTAPTLSDEQLAERRRQLVHATASDNTRRSYSSDVQHFLNWGGLLPTEEDTLIRYLIEHEQLLNSRTLAHRLAALSKWHVQLGFRDPTRSAEVRETLTGIQRTRGRPVRQAKALPVEDLTRIVRVLVAGSDLAALRDNALLQMGFLGGFRRSELVAITVENLLWEPQGLSVVLPRSKTDQLGQGLLRAIPYGEQGALCAASALRAWLHAAGIASGPVFRPLTRGGHVRAQALGGSSVSAILVLRAQQAGLPYVPELSAHSLRRGMATSAHRAGADAEAIKRQGGWKRDATVRGYIEEADRFENNALKAILAKNTTVR
jgi:integrase